MPLDFDEDFFIAQEKVEELKGEFLNLDLDCDGTITIAELAKVLISMRGALKASDTDIKRALRQIDKNGDGILNLVEYYQTMQNCPHYNLVHRALVMRSSARQEFAKIDVDGSGYLEMDEIKQVLEAKTQHIWSSEQVEAILKKADRNRDGQINYDEFLSNVYGKLDDVDAFAKEATRKKRFSFKRRNRENGGGSMKKVAMKSHEEDEDLDLCM